MKAIEVSGATHYSYLSSAGEDGVSLRLTDGTEVVVWQDGTIHDSKSWLDAPVLTGRDIEAAKRLFQEYMTGDKKMNKNFAWRELSAEEAMQHLVDCFGFAPATSFDCWIDPETGYTVGEYIAEEYNQ